MTCRSSTGSIITSARVARNRGRLCFQVPESVAASHIEQLQALAAALRQRGFRFALEAFGAGRDSHDSSSAWG